MGAGCFTNQITINKLMIERAHLDTHHHGHRDKHCRGDHRVWVARHARNLEPARARVQDDTPGDQKARQLVIHPGQRLDGCSAPKQQRGGDDDVDVEHDEEEREVDGLAPAGTDDLAHGVGVGDGEDAKEEDPDGGTGGAPEGPDDVALSGDVQNIEEGDGPGQLGVNDGRGQAGLDLAFGSNEVFTCLFGIAQKHLVQVYDDHRNVEAPLWI